MRKTKYTVPRTTVAAEHSSISPSELEQRLGDLKTYIEDLIDTYGSDAHLDFGQHNKWDDHYTYVVRRPETDEEYSARCKEYAEQETLREQNERAEYERLQKKYGAK